MNENVTEMTAVVRRVCGPRQDADGAFSETAEPLLEGGLIANFPLQVSFC